MTTLVEAFTTLTDLTKTSEPMVTFLTREVNLYLDVLRVYGKRDKLTETDLHILFARLLDLAQIQPLAGPEPTVEGVQGHITGVTDMTQLTNQIKETTSPVVKMYAPKGKNGTSSKTSENGDEARL